MKTLPFKIPYPVRLHLFATLLLSLAAFSPALAQHEEPCNFAKLKENCRNFMWLPNLPAPGQPFQVPMDNRGRLDPACGVPVFIFGVQIRPNGAFVDGKGPCTNPGAYTSGVLDSTQILAVLIFNYVLRKEVHRSAGACAGGVAPEYSNPTTDFSLPHLRRFLECLFAILNKWETEGTAKDKENAAKLREVLKGVLGKKVALIGTALAATPPNLGSLESKKPPTKTAGDHAAEADYLKKVIAEVTDKPVGGGLTVPRR